MGNLMNFAGITGLTSREVKERQEREGFNELPTAGKRSILRIALEVFKEPMFLLLVACGSLYLLLGDIGEALMLLGFVFVVMGITIFQERKTERALEALRDLSSPRALVIRDNERQRIPGREVVRGDTIILAEGDRVPADAVLIDSLNLAVDESLLTGESVAVRKNAVKEIQPMGAPGGDDLPFVFSGTLVVQGQGIAVVQGIGLSTEIGKIGKALQTIGTEKTLLQQEIGRLVRNLAVLGLVLCLLVVIVFGLTRGNWLHGLLAGITLAMAMLPEEFPVVLTVFLALGAWRMSQKKVLTRREAVVETLGSATVLCVDKTGTLTRNQMVLKRLYAGGRFFTLNGAGTGPLPEGFHKLVEYAILASQKDPFDPMERALRQVGDSALSNTEHLHHDWSLVQEYPLSKELLALSHVWKSPDGVDYVIASKGAPEAIADLCHLEPSVREDLNEKVRRMADDGLRVLGVARASFQESQLPSGQHDFQFQFLGLVGLVDPVRATVPQAIQECYRAGIRVAMITGDYPGTAQSIAKEIGLAKPEMVITGPEIEALSDEELQQRIAEVSIFARVVPEQKLRIVNALKARGEVVAMTGDGVNDAPALKSAHIGIAMGERGTDVAREASALVLLDDHFASIVTAVRQGRKIFDNLKKAMTYIFSVHVPIAGLSLIPVLFKWPLILLPVHIVFLELIIDPACSVVFEAEPEEADVMERPPRNPKEPLFSSRTLLVGLMQGFSVLVIVLGVFAIAINNRELSEAEARSFTFATLIVANLGLILTNRSWSQTIFKSLRTPNTALWWVTGGAVFFLGLVLNVPFLRSLFRFAPLHAGDLAICLTAGILSIAWFEGFKLLRRHRKFPTD
ncbi:MAG TPA: cation-translocating P-type ATPase [Bacillota bacterium]